MFTCDQENSMDHLRQAESEMTACLTVTADVLFPAACVAGADVWFNQVMSLNGPDYNVHKSFLSVSIRAISQLVKASGAQKNKVVLKLRNGPSRH